jgi:hypothetical protein
VSDPRDFGVGEDGHLEGTTLPVCLPLRPRQRAQATGLTAEERRRCRVARIAASNEVDLLLDIIERLTDETFESGDW